MHILPFILIALYRYTSIAGGGVKEVSYSIINTAEDDEDNKGKLVMSSFLSKKGIRIRTYASRVDNPKGHIILIHGFGTHFRSSFCRYDFEWYEKYVGDFVDSSGRIVFDKELEDIFPDLKSLKKDGAVNNDSLNGINAFDRAPRFLYERSFLHVINKLGYSVYGLDLQSHGLSGGVCKQRCYVDDFDDYVYDVMQFVSIVKRGSFDNKMEVWDEQVVFSDQRHDNLPYYLIGLSMGGNIVLKSQLLFDLNTKRQGQFIDSIVSMSSMLNIDLLGTRCNRLLYPLLWLYSFVAPRSKIPIEILSGSGKGFRMFMSYFSLLPMSNLILHSTRRSTVGPADSSSIYFPVNGKTTPRDRGEGSDGSSIMGMMKDGAKVNSTRPRVEVEPVADLREAEGEVIRRGITPSGMKGRTGPLDPLYYSKRLSSWTLISIYNSIYDLRNNMHNYPKDLPTLFIHSEDDRICSIDGPREYMNTYFKESDVVKLVELNGKSHIVTMLSHLPLIKIILEEWFNSLDKM